MDLTSYDAILFPADGRAPHLVQLTTSPVTQIDPKSGQISVVSMMPHPEVHMTSIAEDNGQRPWGMQFIDSLEGMTKKFEYPFIIFYPTISRTGTSFSANKAIKDIQGKAFSDEKAWRGDVIIAKYHDSARAKPFMSFIDIAMSDFPLLKNYLATHGPTTEIPSNKTVSMRTLKRGRGFRD